jgi:uncharacterized delta-60 repeat protein
LSGALVAAIASIAIGGTVATTTAGAAGFTNVTVPTFPVTAAVQQAGIVDLAQGSGTGGVAALKGLGGKGYFGAVALNGEGVPDASFGGDGYTDPLTPTFEGVAYQAQAEATVVQPDGKVVIAGYLEEGARQPKFFSPLLARYGADGSLDPTFGAGGIIGSRPHGHARPQLHDVAVAVEGTILAAGGREESGFGFHAPAGVLTAYRPDGMLDTAFGGSGSTVFKGKRRGYTTLRAVDVLPSGKILVAGFLNYRLLLARLDADGRLDRGFGGGDGKVTLDLHANVCCQAAELAVASDGRIIVAASGGNAQKRRVFLARYLPSGRPDRSFGVDGVEASLPPRHLTDLGGIAIQADGAIVTVGRAAHGRSTAGTFAAFRNRPSGPPDRGFGHGGLETLPEGSESSAGAALDMPTGVLVGGSSVSSSSAQTSLLLARLAG